MLSVDVVSIKQRVTLKTESELDLGWLILVVIIWLTVPLESLSWMAYTSCNYMIG